MMINPKKGILLIRKHKKSGLSDKVDMIIEEMDEDKRLITGEILYVNEVDSEYKAGDTVIFGKYALFPLTLQGKDFYFLDKNDVIATSDYKE